MEFQHPCCYPYVDAEAVPLLRRDVYLTRHGFHLQSGFLSVMVEICTALRCTVIRLLRTKARPCWALEKRRSGDRLWGTEMVNGNAMMEKRRIQSWTKNSKSGAMQEKQLRRKSEKVPRGFIPVSVGRTDDERKRFLLPVAYLNHPLFQDLLQEASREYGFHHAGILLLPCSIREFENVQITIGFHPRLR